MGSEIAVVVISDVVTFALSLTAVLFAAGYKWAEVKRDIAEIKHDIAQIQGMFVIRIRHDSIDKE
jgi:hypothetical protein